MATNDLGPPDTGFVDKRRTTSVANGATVRSATAQAAYVSQTAMDTRLIAIGYTQKQIDSMTTNDKVYAIRVADDPLSI
jgi:hypothetical protein